MIDSHWAWHSANLRHVSAIMLMSGFWVAHQIWKWPILIQMHTMERGWWWGFAELEIHVMGGCDVFCICLCQYSIKPLNAYSRGVQPAGQMGLPPNGACQGIWDLSHLCPLILITCWSTRFVFSSWPRTWTSVRWCMCNLEQGSHWGSGLQRFL